VLVVSFLSKSAFRSSAGPAVACSDKDMGCISEEFPVVFFCCLSYVMGHLHIMMIVIVRGENRANTALS